MTKTKWLTGFVNTGSFKSQADTLGLTMKFQSSQSRLGT